MYCSCQCAANNTKLKQQRLKKFRETHKNNPTIKQNEIKNRLKTIKSKPRVTAKDNYDKNIKTSTESYCLICNSKTRFVNAVVGYKKYCSNLCSNKDKDLQKIKTQNYMNTLAANPDINIKRNKTLSVMWQSNPDIIKRAIKATTNLSG